MKPKLTPRQAEVLGRIAEKQCFIMRYWVLLHGYTHWLSNGDIVDARVFNNLLKKEWIEFVRDIEEVKFYTITPAGIAAVKEGK